MISTLADQIYRYRYEYIKDNLNFERLKKEHHAIADAVIKGDAEAAAAASSVHVDNQELAILSQLRKDKG